MWLIALARAAPCDLDQDVMTAYGALVEGDLEEAERALGSAEDALGCPARPSEPQSLGRFWLVEGALLVAAGDPSSSLSFAAARRVAPALWLSALGEPTHRLWETALAETGTGMLAFDIELRRRRVSVDGRAWGGEALPAGLHAIQLQEGDGRLCFGAMVYVGAGTATTVTTGLQPEPAPEQVVLPPPVEELPRPIAPSVLLEGELAAGASLALGERLEAPSGGGTLHEPGIKLVFPLLVSGRLRRGGGWLQLEGGAGWLVAGPYLSVKADGHLHRTPVRLDVAVGGGSAVGSIDLGLLTGIQWPGRLSERLVASFELPASEGVLTAEPLSLGVRAGFNLATDRPVEPGLEVLLGVRLR